MGTAKIGVMILLGWVLIIYGGLTFLIARKKDVTLISGFSNRSKEEQEYLKKSGFVEALSKLLVVTFLILLVTYVLWILSVPYSMEIGMSFFTFLLLAGILWMQRYEVPQKRKRMYWITGTISVLLVAFIAVLVYVGFDENEVIVQDGLFQVVGMYGIEWKVKDVQDVELLEELPEVKVRSNGFAAAGHLKGRFLLAPPYGGGLLFIQEKSGPPYLYVAVENDYLILNRKNAKETSTIYATLQSQRK